MHHQPHILRNASRAILLLVSGLSITHAAELKQARVTQVVKDVRLLPTAAAARPAVVTDEVRDGTAVRTGVDSRAELTFTDATLARLGANTIFSFTEGTRNLDLKDGAMLLRVPKDAGGAKINTAAVTAAITGTTVMLEYHPHSYIKFIVLEGTGRIFVPSRVGESVLVKAGQMLITKPDTKNLPGPVDVDVKKIMKTSRLITGFRKLGSQSLIAQTASNQDAQRAKGELYETNLAILGGGTDVILIDPTHIPSAASSPPPSPPPVPTPTPPPSEFGPPRTITSPNPYGLGGNTAIQLGPPTITSNGIVDYGTIYRSPAIDGPRSVWFFGTTRTFDSTIGFDSGQSVFNLDNLAAFKFQNLSLLGNPVMTASGASNLALIGVGGMSTGPFGATLTFAGINTVLLVTQNGPIILGSEVSFDGIPQLIFYARGDDPALRISSHIADTIDLFLASEGTVQINGNMSVTNFTSMSGSDFLRGDGVVIGQNVAISSVAGNVFFDSTRFPDLPNGGGTVALQAAGTLTILPSGWATTNRDSFIGRAGTIAFNTSAPFRFDFSGSNSVSFDAGDGGILAGHINFVGPNLTLHSDSDIRLLGTELPSVNQTLVLSGSITAAASISAAENIQTGAISAGNDITAGGTIDAGAITAGGQVSAAGGIRVVNGSIFAGGDISSGAGRIQLIGGANQPRSVVSGGDLFAGGGIFANSPDVTIQAGGNLTAPGIITGTLNAGGDISIANVTGTSISAVVADTVNARRVSMFDAPGFFPNYPNATGHDGVTPDNFVMTIDSLNSVGPRIPVISANGSGAFNFLDSNPGNGGQITLAIRNAGLRVASDGDLSSIAANGGNFNPGGSIVGGGNGGNITVITTGGLALDSPVEATTGYTQGTSATAGTGGSISLTSTAGPVSVSSRIEASSNDAVNAGAPRRHSSRGGNIALRSDKQSGVAINVSNTGQLLALLDAAAPGPGGKVTILATGANSTANLNGTVIADRGTIDMRHTGDNGQVNVGGPSAGDNINARADIIKVGALGTNGVLNIGNGLLSADTTLSLYAPGSNGTINFLGNVTLGGASTKIIAGNAINIFNGVVVNVGGQNPANVFTNNANYSGFGGNGSRTGTFSGAGARNPQPLNQAPPFGPPPGG